MYMFIFTYLIIGNNGHARHNEHSISLSSHCEIAE